MFVPGKPLWLRKIFAGKAAAYRAMHLDTPLKGRLLALPKNIAQGSKCLPVTNTLAYIPTVLVTKKKVLKINVKGQYHTAFSAITNFAIP